MYIQGTKHLLVIFTIQFCTFEWFQSEKWKKFLFIKNGPIIKPNECPHWKMNYISFFFSLHTMVIIVCLQSIFIMHVFLSSDMHDYVIFITLKLRLRIQVNMDIKLSDVNGLLNELSSQFHTLNTDASYFFVYKFYTKTKLMIKNTFWSKMVILFGDETQIIHHDNSYFQLFHVKKKNKNWTNVDKMNFDSNFEFDWIVGWNVGDSFLNNQTVWIEVFRVKCTWLKS